MMFALTLAFAAAALEPRNGQNVGLPIPFSKIGDSSQCRKAIPRFGPLCAQSRFDGGFQIEIALADFDGDGHEDVAIRSQSPLDCGSRGCSTKIFRGLRGGGFRQVIWPHTPPVRTETITSEGAIIRCSTEGEPGIAFPDRGTRYLCFPLTRKPGAKPLI